MWNSIGWGSKSTPAPQTSPEPAQAPASTVSSNQTGDYSLKARAENGDAQAQYELGVRYFEGREVPKDTIEALRWFKMSADGGVASGQIKLGWMYENGRSVAQDLAEARRWYAKAADQGNPFAEKALKNLDAKKAKASAPKKPKPAKKPAMVANVAAPSAPSAPAVKQTAPAKSSQKEDWKKVRKALEQELIKGLLQGLNKKKR